MFASPRKRRTRRSFGQVKTSASGRRYASYVGPDRQRHHAPYSFATVTDADGWLASQRVTIEAGLWTPNTPLHPSVVEAKQLAAERAVQATEPTLAEYACHWVRTRRRRGEPLAGRTQAEYLNYIERDLAELGALRMSALTERDVATWFEHKRTTSSIALLEKSYVMLSTIFKSAVSDNELPLVASNPCTVPGGKTVYTAKRKHDQTVKVRSALVTPEELATMLDAVDDWFRAAVLIGAWLGLRNGEVRELRRKDILVDADGSETTLVVHVARGVTSVTSRRRGELEKNLRSGQSFDEDGYLVGPTKSQAGERMILVPPHIVPDLVEHLETFVPREPDALLFSSRVDARRHLSVTSFYENWDKARKVAGRPTVSFHDLRHHAATEYALSGATLRELMERLGHSSVEVAMIYQHTAEQRDKELTRKMSERATATTAPSDASNQNTWIASQFAELRALLTNEKENA